MPERKPKPPKEPPRCSQCHHSAKYHDKDGCTFGWDGNSPADPCLCKKKSHHDDE